MAAPLSVEIKDVDDISYVKLSGVIDEDNDLSEIANRVKHKTVLIDSAHVERINSCGIRDWVTWLGELDKKGCRVVLLRCSPAMVTQVNLVNNFAASDSIVNFYAPYYCAECEQDKMMLVDTEDALKQKPFRAPSARCEKANCQMEFDDIEDSYFGFLNSIKTPKLDDKLKNAIKKLTKDDEGFVSRSSSSQPLSTLEKQTPSSVTSNPAGSAPTLAGGNFRPLLETSPEIKVSEMSTAAPASGGGKLIYVIIGLLVVAIGLLAFVVLQSK